MESGVEPMMGDCGPLMGRGRGGRPPLRGGRGGRGRGGPGRPPRGGIGANIMTYGGGRGGGAEKVHGIGGGERGRGGGGGDRGRGGDWGRSIRGRTDKRGRGGGRGGGMGLTGSNNLGIDGPGLFGNGDRRGGRGGEGRGMTRGMGPAGRGGRPLLGMGGLSRGPNVVGETLIGLSGMDRENSWDNSTRGRPNGPPMRGAGAPRRGGGPPAVNQPPPKRPRWEDANPPPPSVNGYPVGRPRPTEEPRPPFGSGGGGPGMGNNTYCSGEYNYGMPRGGINGRQFSESQGVRNGAGNQWNPGRPNASGGDRGYVPDNSYGTGMADYSNGANSVPYGSMDRGSGGGLAYPPPVNHDPFNVPPVKPPYEVNQRPSDGGGYGNSNASAVNPYGGLPSYEDRGRYGGNFGNFDAAQGPVGTSAGGGGGGGGGPGYNGGPYAKDYTHGLVNRSGNEDRYGYDAYGGAAPQGAPAVGGAGATPLSAYAPPRDQYGPPVGGGVVGPGGGGGGGGGGGYGGVRGQAGGPPPTRRY